jgi:deazaflavin-dependent oxidoreductase (nitroreductase family)
MPSDFQLKTMNAVHRTLLKASGGHLGWKFSGLPVVELTTTGRKTGRDRTVLLISPTQQGDAIVVVASRGGDDQDPAWFLNLRDNPDVTATVGGKPKQAMRARIATPDERAELWPRVTDAAKNYATYQTKTERVIPLVLLEPVA